MSDTALALIISTVIGCIVGIITAFSTGIKDYIIIWFKLKTQRLMRQQHGHGLQMLGEFRAIIDDMESLPYIERVLVFAGQDSGGIPTPGNPYTVKALDGWSKEDPELPERFRFEYQVDTSYCNMLSKMINDGFLRLTVSDMPDGILRSIYREEGVIDSLLYFIDINDHVLIYMTVASYKNLFTTDQIVKIELYIQRIRAILYQNR